MRLLTSQENTKMFIQKSIRIFIDLMWEVYQPVIVKWVFIPYLVYLFAFVFLCSSIAGNYLKLLDPDSQTGDSLS